MNNAGHRLCPNPRGAKTLILFLFISWISRGLFGAEMQTQPFEFSYAGNALRGFLDLPASGEASSLIVIVHGHGQTSVADGQWYDLRSRFTELGIATCLWDKAGCGTSDGVYDHEQTVQSSAAEVMAALSTLRSGKAPGIERIGLWGISRAGWICPLVIKADPSIAFWISVSGTDAKESFGYLLKTNLRIEGRNEAEVEALYSEWKAANRVFQTGGSLAESLEANRNLRNDPFYKEYFEGVPSEAEYRAQQAKFLAGKPTFDGETGLLIYVPHFRETLSGISCPVLAIFGEKDSQVDWRSTLALYRDAFAAEQLVVRTFPSGNHNIQKSDTGGFREMLENSSQWNPCDGYYDAMTDWLATIQPVGR